MKTYTPQEQLNTNITLEPVKCPKCGSLETVYNQYAHVVICQDCGVEYIRGITDEDFEDVFLENELLEKGFIQYRHKDGYTVWSKTDLLGTDNLKDWFLI